MGIVIFALWIGTLLASNFYIYCFAYRRGFSHCVLDFVKSGMVTTSQVRKLAGRMQQGKYTP
jgi:hypothetical protein